jgi:hypothetical protein
MSQRSNAPYNDEILPDGLTIIYEGHDVSKTRSTPSPKVLDQPRTYPSGKLTQNGKFAEAIERFKCGANAERVRVYEKLFSGVWSFRGKFELADYTFESDGTRKVFRFVLRLGDSDIDMSANSLKERSRVIPTEVKKAVWERDHGKCVICGATDELHFDHDIPYSKGGTSVSVENVRILCARHNLKKSDRIE